MKTSLTNLDMIWLYTTTASIGQRCALLGLTKHTFGRYAKSEEYQDTRDYAAQLSKSMRERYIKAWSLQALTKDQGIKPKRAHLNLCDVQYILTARFTDERLAVMLNVSARHVKKIRSGTASHSVLKCLRSMPGYEKERLMLFYRPRPIDSKRETVAVKKRDFSKNLACLPLHRLPEVYGLESKQC